MHDRQFTWRARSCSCSVGTCCVFVGGDNAGGFKTPTDGPTDTQKYNKIHTSNRIPPPKKRKKGKPCLDEPGEEGPVFHQGHPLLQIPVHLLDGPQGKAGLAAEEHNHRVGFGLNLLSWVGGWWVEFGWVDGWIDGCWRHAHPHTHTHTLRHPSFFNTPNPTTQRDDRKNTDRDEAEEEDVAAAAVVALQHRLPQGRLGVQPHGAVAGLDEVLHDVGACICVCVNGGGWKG